MMKKKTIILTSGASAIKLLFFVIKHVTATDKYLRLVLTSKALDGLKTTLPLLIKKLQYCKLAILNLDLSLKRQKKITGV